MRANRSRDTGPELLLRRLLFRKGLRFRVHYRPNGLGRCSVDVAFPRPRVAVLIDGCFWHACPQHGSVPEANSAFWAKKLEENVARDVAVSTRLTELGWFVIRVWEHDIPQVVAGAIADVVRKRIGAVIIDEPETSRHSQLCGPLSARNP